MSDKPDGAATPGELRFKIRESRKETGEFNIQDSRKQESEVRSKESEGIRGSVGQSDREAPAFGAAVAGGERGVMSFYTLLAQDMRMASGAPGTVAKGDDLLAQQVAVRLPAEARRGSNIEAVR